MIKRNSVEWDQFIVRLNTIKTKSNREVLCIQCWQMLNCKQKIKHLKSYPDHKPFLLTSTQYASEHKISELAQGYNKLIKKSDGEEYMISPFAPVNLPQLGQAKMNQSSAGQPQDSNSARNLSANTKQSNERKTPTKGQASLDAAAEQQKPGANLLAKDVAASGQSDPPVPMRGKRQRQNTAEFKIPESPVNDQFEGNKHLKRQKIASGTPAAQKVADQQLQMRAHDAPDPNHSQLGMLSGQQQVANPLHQSKCGQIS